MNGHILSRLRSFFIMGTGELVVIRLANSEVIHRALTSLQGYKRHSRDTLRKEGLRPRLFRGLCDFVTHSRVAQHNLIVSSRWRWPPRWRPTAF